MSTDVYGAIRAATLPEPAENGLTTTHTHNHTHTHLHTTHYTPPLGGVGGFVERVLA